MECLKETGANMFQILYSILKYIVTLFGRNVPLFKKKINTINIKLPLEEKCPILEQFCFLSRKTMVKPHFLLPFGCTPN